MKLNNNYYILRHGEATSNVKNIVSCWPEKFKNPLTKKGVSQIKSAANKLKNKKIDLIFASPILRTKESAEIVGRELGVKIKLDQRLREIGFGNFNAGPADDFIEQFKSLEERIKGKAIKGENFIDVSKRMFGFLKEVNKKYKDKNILIVSHQAPLLILRAKVRDASILKNVEELRKIFDERKITKGELLELN